MENLFLKAERSLSQKSAMVRRPTRPGMHGKVRRSLSEYGEQLLEKQKIRLTYGLRERQFERYIDEALSQQKLPASEYLVRALESRLDNAVFRLGWAPSRSVARIVVSHGHILVNGRRVDVPSFSLKPGDRVELRPTSRDKKIFSGLQDRLKKYAVPKWLELDKPNLSAKVLAWPGSEDAQLSFNIQLVLEFYSR